MTKYLLAMGLLGAICLLPLAPVAFPELAAQVEKKPKKHPAEEIDRLLDALGKNALPKVEKIDIIVRRTRASGPTVIEIHGLREAEIRVMPTVDASVWQRGDRTVIAVRHAEVSVGVSRTKDTLLTVYRGVPRKQGEMLEETADVTIPIPEKMPYRVVRTATKADLLKD